MNNNQKMALTGAGLITAAIGLSVAGVALMTPLFVQRSAGVVEKAADILLSRLEGLSKVAGTIAGTIHSAIKAA